MCIKCFSYSELVIASGSFTRTLGLSLAMHLLPFLLFVLSQLLCIVSAYYELSPRYIHRHRYPLYRLCVGLMFEY